MRTISLLALCVVLVAAPMGCERRTAGTLSTDASYGGTTAEAPPATPVAPQAIGGGPRDAAPGAEIPRGAGTTGFRDAGVSIPPSATEQVH